jgi:hypothetical protein
VTANRDTTSRKFKTKLGDGFLELPFDVKAEFGSARAPVNVAINGYSFRSTVCVYGGKYFVPVRKDRQNAAGVKPGDTVEAAIAPDTKERLVEPPPDLAAALKKNPRAREQWDKLSYTDRREHAEAIEGAKKPETRARRLKSTLEKLARGS